METLTAIGITVPSVIQPLKPPAEEWLQLSVPRAIKELGGTAEAWVHESGLCVISGVEVVAPEPGEENKGPEYHISISKDRGGIKTRASSNEAKWVLEQFKCDGAEEDNHVPHGIVRNFWRPVNDNLVGMECACKADEPAIREDKGDFVWRPV